MKKIVLLMSVLTLAASPSFAKKKKSGLAGLTDSIKEATGNAKEKAKEATQSVTSAADSKDLSEDEKSKFESWKKYINDMDASYAKYPVDMCGKALPITMNVNLVKPFVAAGNNAEMYCEEIRTKLSTMCRNAADLGNNNKEKINKLISKIDCGIADKEDAVNFKISSGTLQVKIGAKSSNLSEELLKFLDSTH